MAPVDDIINQIQAALNLNNLKPSLDRLVNEKYISGMDKAGELFDMNFVPNGENLQTLQDTMQENIQNQGLEISHKIKGDLQRWKLSDGTMAQAKQLIKEAMKKKNWSYKVKRVVRTESLRANNMGSLDGAKQSGVKLKKWIDVIMDDVTSNICKKEHSKYGSPDKAIPLDKQFIVRVDNKTIRGQAPPFHPNCRSVIRFVRDEE